jgi:hypothetical protein
MTNSFAPRMCRAATLGAGLGGSATKAEPRSSLPGRPNKKEKKMVFKKKKVLNF